ncbi:MAG TPA: serine protease [Hyphomonadaceae bacterium]|nr:serine protease [Hyphomonadaceae bacterium]
MRIPDWLIYTLVLIVVVATLFWRSGETPSARPAPLQVAEIPSTPDATDGPALPDADPFDERVLVQVGDAEDGIGTAFAINESGAWLTARHVVDGCSRVGLAVGDGRMVRVNEVKTSKTSDLALLITDRAPAALPMHLDHELRIGEAGYHVGFPQGRSGEAYSRLQARSKLVTRGRYTMEEPVLAWAEKERSDGIDGTLSGMSGGPVFDKDGAVVGVTVAESPRRGRIYTAAPSSIQAFLDQQGLVAPGSDAHPIAASSYVHEADRLREERAVVKVLCRVGDR